MFFASVQCVHLSHNLHKKSISPEGHFLKYYQLNVNRVNREVAAFIFIPCHGYLVTSGMAVSWGCQLLHSSWRDLSSGDLCDHGGFFGGFAGHWKISEGLWQVCWTTFLLYILRWPQVPEASNPLDQSNYWSGAFNCLFSVLPLQSPGPTEPINWMLCNGQLLMILGKVGCASAVQTRAHGVAQSVWAIMSAGMPYLLASRNLSSDCVTDLGDNDMGCLDVAFIAMFVLELLDLTTHHFNRL